MFFRLDQWLHNIVLFTTHFPLYSALSGKINKDIRIICLSHMHLQMLIFLACFVVMSTYHTKYTILYDGCVCQKVSRFIVKVVIQFHLRIIVSTGIYWGWMNILRIVGLYLLIYRRTLNVHRLILRPVICNRNCLNLGRVHRLLMEIRLYVYRPILKICGLILLICMMRPNCYSLIDVRLINCILSWHVLRM
jgi:hypothetical protein